MEYVNTEPETGKLGEEEKEKDNQEKSAGKKEESQEDIEKLIKGRRGSNFSIFVHHMNYVNNNSGAVFGDGTELEEFELGQKEKTPPPPQEEGKNGGRECALRSPESLRHWMANHYQDFEMAFLIALAVFEDSPYLWIYEMADDLYAMFDMDEAERSRQRLEKEKMPGRQRIETAGARQYQSKIYNHTGPVESDFLGFVKPEYRGRILECVWKEFLFLREKLVQWLKSYVFCGNYTKISRAVEALSQLAKLDFYYFDKNVVPFFLKEKQIMTDYAVAQIMIRAYEAEQYQHNIESQVKHWATLGNLHYSLTALMVCGMGNWNRNEVELVVDAYMKYTVEELQGSRQKGYLDNLSALFEIGGRKAVYFKAVVSALYERLNACKGRKRREERIGIGLIFFILLQLDYDQSNIDVTNAKNHKDMIFVKMCFIKNETTPKLLELWKFIWNSREFRKYTQKFLEMYLYQYGGCGQEQIRYLKQFLYSFQESEAERKEMEFFLRKITFQMKRPVKAAERIHYQYDSEKRGSDYK